MEEKKEMCKQRIALEMIKSQKNKGGLSKTALFLHEEQSKDFEEMSKRMLNLEKKVDSISIKLDHLINLSKHNNNSIGISLKEVLSNKVFLYVIITLLCASFGVSVGEVGTFLFK